MLVVLWIVCAAPTTYSILGLNRKIRQVLGRRGNMLQPWNGALRDGSNILSVARVSGSMCVGGRRSCVRMGVGRVMVSKVAGAKCVRDGVWGVVETPLDVCKGTPGRLQLRPPALHVYTSAPRMPTCRAVVLLSRGLQTLPLPTSTCVSGTTSRAPTPSRPPMV